MIEDYMTGAVIPDDMPEDLLGNPDVQKLIDNTRAVLEHFEDWIDPNSERYGEELHEARVSGADAVMDWYQSMLADALHRQKMFGEVFDLEGFIDLQNKITVTEVLEEAR